MFLNIDNIVNKIRDAYNDDLSKESIQLFLLTYPHRWFVWNNCVVFYFRLSDTTLELLKRGLLDLSNSDVIHILLNENGDNTHIFCCVGSGVKNLLRIGKMLKRKSISWYRPKMDKLVYFNGRR